MRHTATKWVRALLMTPCAVALGLVLLLCGTVSAEVQLVKQGDAWQLRVDGAPFIVRGVELQNYDYLSPSDIPHLDQMIDYRLAYNVNTLLVPIPWNTFEPTKGVYDYRMIDSLILKCRAKGMHCIPLWFATWKNGGSGYAPGWLLGDPNVYMMQSEDGGASTGISAFCAYAMEADKRAFAALLARIKLLDENHHTVLMVQPENEVGGYPGGGRDFCPAAQLAWNAPVPTEMMAFLNTHKGTMVPWLEQLWRKFGYRSGSWAEVLGNTWEGGPQAFLGYYLARYCGEVAAAGKAAYNIPMFCNWGYGLVCGPSWMTIDMWKVAAPSVDAVAPDIYEDDFEWRVAQYDYQSNPVMVPESHGGFAHALWMFIEHNGILFSRYEGEAAKYLNWDNGTSGSAYALIRDMQPVINARSGALPRTMRAWSQEYDQSAATANTGVFDGYSVTAVNTQSADGVLALLKMGANDYVAVGANVTMQLRRLYDPVSSMGVQSANRGHFANGQWSNDNAVTLAATSDMISYTFPNGKNQAESIRFKLYGSAPKPELAFRRPTQASSWQDNGHSRQATDDDMSTDWVSGNGQNPWWQVDLVQACPITAVQIVASQTNTNSSWRCGLQIQASNTADFATLDVLGSQGSTAFTGTLTVAVASSVAYRYLRVKKTDTATQFGFAEVRVFGDAPAAAPVVAPIVDGRDASVDEFRVVKTRSTLHVIGSAPSVVRRAGNRAETIEAQLVDCAGRALSVSFGVGTVEISTARLPRGMYLVRLRSGSESACVKIMLP